MQAVYIYDRASMMVAVAEVEDVRKLHLNTPVTYRLLQNRRFSPTALEAMLDTVKAATWDEARGRLLQSELSNGTIQTLDQLVAPRARNWRRSFKLLLPYHGYAAGTSVGHLLLRDAVFTPTRHAIGGVGGCNARCIARRTLTILLACVAELVAHTT